MWTYYSPVNVSGREFVNANHKVNRLQCMFVSSFVSESNLTGVACCLAFTDFFFFRHSSFFSLNFVFNFVTPYHLYGLNYFKLKRGTTNIEIRTGEILCDQRSGGTGETRKEDTSRKTYA
jgi:hypothetical protein